MAAHDLARRSRAALLFVLLGCLCTGDGGFAQEPPQGPRDITLTTHRYDYSQPRIDVTQEDVIRL